MCHIRLTCQQVRDVIDGKADHLRIPMLLKFWVHPESFGDREQAVLDILGRYPEDVAQIQPDLPHMFEGRDDDPEYRWMNIEDPYVGKNVGHDAKIAISDWTQLDGVLEKLPNPNYAGMFGRKIDDTDIYKVCAWWYCLFERHWSFRGMTNALMDFYTDPESVHRLYRACTDFYMVMIERASGEQNADAIFFSDDIGTQDGPFFSLDIFREFFKPYYKEMIDKAHSLGMHFWMHCCGNILPFIPEFIEIGLDVLHPIQKYTMDEKMIAEKYGKDICIWAGFDVQQTIPWGTVDEVRKEVRFLFDTYYRPDGRLVFGAGNGVNGDCPVSSLEALFEEAYKYGTEIAERG